MKAATRFIGEDGKVYVQFGNNVVYPAELFSPEKMRSVLDDKPLGPRFGEMKHPSVHLSTESSKREMKNRLLRNILFDEDFIRSKLATHESYRKEQDMRDTIANSFYGYQVFGDTYIVGPSKSAWAYFKKLRSFKHPIPSTLFQKIAEEFEVPNVSPRSEINVLPDPWDVRNMTTQSMLSLKFGSKLPQPTIQIKDYRHKIVRAEVSNETISEIIRRSSP